LPQVLGERNLLEVLGLRYDFKRLLQLDMGLLELDMILGANREADRGQERH
jgi:hypothetical protein